MHVASSGQLTVPCRAETNSEATTIRAANLRDFLEIINLNQLEVAGASGEVLCLLKQCVLFLWPTNDVGMARWDIVWLEAKADIQDRSRLEDPPSID